VGPDPATTAAENRQRSFKSVTVNFKLVERMSAGAVSKGDPMYKGSTKIVPAKETLLESENIIAVDGNRVRIERNHPVFHAPTGQLTPHRMEAYFNGEVAKVYYPNGVNNEGKGAGVIEQAARQEMTRESKFLPIMMFIRGADDACSPYPFPKFRPTGARLIVSGANCLEYVFELAPGGQVRAWLDPAEEYIIRRLQHQRAEKLTRQTDISYRKDPSLGRLIESWVATSYFDDGTVSSSVEGRVKEIRTNEQYKDGYFDVTFAENTEVFDQRNRKYYRVKSDGSMREVSQTGEELSSSEYQPGTPWHRRNRWLLIACAIVLVALVSAILLRRRTRK
jgi:hypothetical protein